MLVEVLFQLVVFIDIIHGHSQDRLSPQAFNVSQSLIEFEYTSSWYGNMGSWFLENSLDINNLAPPRYDQDTFITLISHGNCIK